MLDWVLNTALLLQTLFQPLVSLKYFTSFKAAFRVQICKKTCFRNLIREIEKITGTLQAKLIQDCFTVI